MESFALALVMCIFRVCSMLADLQTFQMSQFGQFCKLRQNCQIGNDIDFWSLKMHSSVDYRV